MQMIDIDRIKRAVMMDEKVYAEIASDKEALPQAVVVVVLAMIIGGLSGIILSGGLYLLLVPLLIVTWVIITGIMHIIAKVLGGKADFVSYLKAIGFGQAPGALEVIPYLGLLIGVVWSVAGCVVATKSVHQLSTGKAVVVVFVPVAILAIVLLVVAVLIGIGFGAFYAMEDPMIAGY
ncbi:MAG: hypothetical protein MSIBF_00600 [Candidatus Altiarchaeales archaeon IMC4]|nr:MAG: hypothetical protein MSIBF_00600 [Candidatus Altiarchaeales archaeon IMC4]